MICKDTFHILMIVTLVLRPSSFYHVSSSDHIIKDKNFFPSITITSDQFYSYVPLVCSGVLDRTIDGKYAVILLDKIDEELVLPIHALPKGSSEQMYFTIKIYLSFVEILSIDHERTRKEKSKTNRLRKMLVK